MTEYTYDPVLERLPLHARAPAAVEDELEVLQRRHRRPHPLQHRRWYRVGDRARQRDRVRLLHQRERLEVVLRAVLCANPVLELQSAHRRREGRDGRARLEIVQLRPARRGACLLLDREFQVEREPPQVGKRVCEFGDLGNAAANVERVHVRPDETVDDALEHASALPKLDVLEGVDVRPKRRHVSLRPGTVLPKAIFDDRGPTAELGDGLEAKVTDVVEGELLEGGELGQGLVDGGMRLEERLRVADMENAQVRCLVQKSRKGVGGREVGIPAVPEASIGGTGEGVVEQTEGSEMPHAGFGVSEHEVAEHLEAVGALETGGGIVGRRDVAGLVLVLVGLANGDVREDARHDNLVRVLAGHCELDGIVDGAEVGDGEEDVAVEVEEVDALERGVGGRVRGIAGSRGVRGGGADSRVVAGLTRGHFDGQRDGDVCGMKEVAVDDSRDGRGSERGEGGLAGVMDEYRLWIRLTVAVVIGRGLAVKMVVAEHVLGRSGPGLARGRALDAACGGVRGGGRQPRHGSATAAWLCDRPSDRLSRASFSASPPFSTLASPLLLARLRTRANQLAVFPSARPHTPCDRPRDVLGRPAAVFSPDAPAMRAQRSQHTHLPPAHYFQAPVPALWYDRA